MKRDKSHTSRQWRLHELLKSHPFEFIKRVDILVLLKDEYYDNPPTDFDIRTSDIYYSQAGAMLNKDILAIKQSLIIKRILVGNSQKGIKYATKEEAEEYFYAQAESIRKKCILINMQKMKYGLNGQYVLQFTGNEKNMIESLEAQDETK